jgi:hypothetical protein
MTSSSYTTSYGDAGTHIVTVTVSDGSLTDSQDVTVTVSNTNLPQNGIIDNGDPGTSYTGGWNVSSGPNPYGSNSLYSNESGATYTFQASEVNDTYEVSLWWTYHNTRCGSVPVDIYDGNSLIDTVYVDHLANSGQWNVLGTYGFSGTAKVVISSQGSCTTSADAVKFVISVNNPPVLDPISDIVINVGATITLNPTANDPDGDTLTYTYSGWMTSSSYTTGYNDVGTHIVTVTVSDGSLNDSQDVMVTVANVTRAPVLDHIADITANEGDTITLNPTATDPDGDALTYTYSGWMTSASYTTGYNDAGVHTVTVTVSDGTLTDSQDVMVTVANVNRAPVLDPIADITANEGDTITLNPTATDPDGDALTYTYSGWMTSASYTTDNNDVGTHTVTVTVSDGSLNDSQDVTIIVNDVDVIPLSPPTGFRIGQS